MFIRRQDLVDSFAANFRDTVEGGIVFQPSDAALPVPVTTEEFDAVMAAFERRQVIDQMISWAVMLGAFAYGGYHVATEDRYLPFFIAIGLGFVFLLCLWARDSLALLLPFIRRGDEMLQAMERESMPGQPVADVNGKSPS